MHKAQYFSHNGKRKKSDSDQMSHDKSIIGEHNIYRSMAGTIASRLLDLRKENIRQCLSDFRNSGHRLEHVASVRGVSFINDSMATNVNATWFALETTGNPLIWIAGGHDTGNDYSPLFELVYKKVKGMVFIGNNNRQIIRAFQHTGIPYVEAGSAMEAVDAAFAMSTPGDTVLLSPACASFDKYESFEERGEHFKKAVYDL